MPASDNSKPTEEDHSASSGADPLLDTLFSGRYQILGVLGSGSAGTTYKAHDQMMDRDIALKVLHGYLLNNPEAIERFKKEALLATELSHPGIVKIYRHARADNGAWFMVMDFLEGESLESLLKKQSRMPLSRFFALFAQIIEALKYAHSKGIVHRDIKPANIWIQQDSGVERAVILDFGIARINSDDGEQSSTKTGALLGTTAYMSPEQCLGKKTDERSDLYSLGCVMLECLTGNPPYSGESSFEVMYKHLNDSLSQLGFLKELPDAIAKIITRCIAKDPADRFQNLKELQQSFDSCAEMQDTLQRKINKTELKSNRTKNALLACAAILAVIGVLAGVYLHRTTHKPYEPQRLTKRLLYPAKDVPIAPTRNSIEDRMNQFPAKEDQLTILRNWQSKYLNDPATEDNAKFAFYEKLLPILLEDQNYTELNTILTRLEKEPVKTRDLRLVIITRAKILQKQKPEKAAELVNNYLKRYKNTFEIKGAENYLSNILEAQGDCYSFLGDYKKAADTYLRALRETGLRGSSDSLRVKTLLELDRSGNQREFNSLLHQCLRTPLVNRDKPLSSADLYMRLSRTSNLQQDYATCKKYGEKAIDQYSASNEKEKEMMFRIEMAEVARNFRDYDYSTKTLQTVLNYYQAPSLERLTVLCALSIIYTATANAEMHIKCAKEALNILLIEARTKPFILWKKRSDSYTAPINNILLDCPLANLSELDEKVQELANLCKGNDCEALGLYAVLHAKILEKQGKPDEALVQFGKAVDIGRRLKEKEPRVLLEALDRRADLLFVRKRPQEAFGDLEEEIMLTKTSRDTWTRKREPSILMHRGAFYEFMNEVPQAEQCYRRAYHLFGLNRPFEHESLDGEHRDLLTRMARIAIAKKQFAESEKLCRRILKSMSLYGGEDRESANIRCLLCQSLQLQGKIPEAKNELKKIIQICSQKNIKDGPYREASKRLADIQQSSAANAVPKSPQSNH